MQLAGCLVCQSGAHRLQCPPGADMFASASLYAGRCAGFPGHEDEPAARAAAPAPAAAAAAAPCKAAPPHGWVQRPPSPLTSIKGSQQRCLSGLAEQQYHALGSCWTTAQESSAASSAASVARLRHGQLWAGQGRWIEGAGPSRRCSCTANAVAGDGSRGCGAVQWMKTAGWGAIWQHLHAAVPQAAGHACGSTCCISGQSVGPNSLCT